jgi:hypothetical protein
MNLRVAAAPPGSKGFDTVAAMTGPLLKRLQALGYTWVARYLGDLSADELTVICGSGYGCLLVQHAHAGGWAGSTLLGTQDGQRAVADARRAGVPAGATLFSDLEGTAGDAAATTAWATAWATAVTTAGYVAGLYVGDRCVLDAAQIYALPHTHYWRSGSAVPEPACSWCVLQLRPLDVTELGVRIDRDVIDEDLRGRTPTLVWAA